MQGHQALGDFASVELCHKEISDYCTINYPKKDIEIYKEADRFNVRVAIHEKENSVKKKIREFLRLEPPNIPVKRLLFVIRSIS